MILNQRSSAFPSIPLYDRRTAPTVLRTGGKRDKETKAARTSRSCATKVAKVAIREIASIFFLALGEGESASCWSVVP